MVSVICLSFNHALYLEKSLSAIISQKTNFKFEIIVHDDCSTDNSLSLINSYSLKYPNLIKVISRSSNVFSTGAVHEPLLSCLKIAKGRYLAFCECDDLWVDNYKLQYQVDFLEKNRNYSIHVLDALAVDETGKELYSSKLEIAGVTVNHLPKSKLLTKFCFLPLTTMCRNPNVDKFPSYFTKSISGDKMMQLILSQIGDAYIEHKVVAKYLVHRNGIWSLKEQDYKFFEGLHTKLAQSQFLLKSEHEYESNVYLVRIMFDIFKRIKLKQIIKVIAIMCVRKLI